VAQPIHRPPVFRPPSDNNVSTTQLPSKQGAGCAWAVVGIVVLVVILSRCTPANTPGGNSTDNMTTNTQAALSSAITAQTPPPEEPLSKGAVKSGFARIKSAMTAEGLAGEMIYSQNCYDALSRKFSWSKLDECGAADMEAVQLLGDGDTTGFEKEAAWFDSEAAAGRYLKAAAAAGESADAADTRLSDLQAAIKRSDATRASRAKAAESATDNVSTEGDDGPVGSNNTDGE
jgi:hypothetical protein